jgi:FtsP/CotA-like multicopper oxidase with cupredoxin domain
MRSQIEEELMSSKTTPQTSSNTSPPEIRIAQWMRAALASTALMIAGAAGAAPLVEPPVFASQNGVLDIMMVAMPQPIPTIAFVPPNSTSVIHPTGWVFQICPRPASGSSCPASSPTVAPYGGTRLALQPGDTLKIRFVNRLPKVDPNKLRHVIDPGEANLYLNPTNLHTHGLLTPARAATVSDPTFGDYVFLTVFNSANGIPVPQTTHQHGPILMDTVDYKITIPPNHPSGLFWFHPHVHGIALNQLSEGMSGLITIGSTGDNVRGDAANAPWPETKVRHMLLKDIQVLAGGTITFDSGDQTVVDGEVLNQEDPAFCTQLPASASEMRQGSCPGTDNSSGGGNNYTGGNWYATVNGQVYPTVTITSADGEVWRVGTGAGSLSWDLQLVDDATQQPMTVQLLAIDGVAVHLPQDTPPGHDVQMAGGRFKVVPCPDAPVIGSIVPVCVNEIVMMPSSRVELWVTYRNSQGSIVPPQPGASATLKMVGLTMGSGDQWPAVDLAKVLFNQAGPQRLTSNHLVVNGPTDAAGLFASPSGIFKAQVPATTGTPTTASTAVPTCQPLAAGHHRRIFFGFSDVTVNNTFALGYEEVDQFGQVVPGSQKPAPDQLERFDPSHVTICLPLGAGGTPVAETWELVQLSTENHNFHLHQTRFVMVGSNGGVIQDNFPLSVAAPDRHIKNQVTNNQNGVCTIPQWRSGHCVSKPIVLSIPFSQLGEFVYHCHILEHEDGGMMARIQVVPAPF